MPKAGVIGTVMSSLLGRKMMSASTMLRRLRPRSSYDLVAVVALVFALGGGL